MPHIYKVTFEVEYYDANAGTWDSTPDSLSLVAQDGNAAIKKASRKRKKTKTRRGFVVEGLERGAYVDG